MMVYEQIQQCECELWGLIWGLTLVSVDVEDAAETPEQSCK